MIWFKKYIKPENIEKYVKEKLKPYSIDDFNAWISYWYNVYPLESLDLGQITKISMEIKENENINTKYFDKKDWKLYKKDKKQFLKNFENIEYYNVNRNLYSKTYFKHHEWSNYLLKISKQDLDKYIKEFKELKIKENG